MTPFDVTLLAAQTEVPAELCVRDAADVGQVRPELLCELLYRATGNELLARAAGAIGTGLRVLLLLVLAFIVMRVLRRLIMRSAATMERRIEARIARDEARGHLDVERYRIRRFQRLHAIKGVANGVLSVLIWFVAVLLILDVLDVSLQPVLAGAGVLSVVIGFGAQQLIRDVLAGIAMLIEDQFGVGDWIQVGDRIGQVERVGLRVTSFRDLDGVLWHALNGSIERVGNLSQEWGRSTLDVPVALDADVPAAKAIIYKVATELAADPVWGEDIIGEPQIWGVQEWGPNGVAIRVVTPTKPMANWDINRQLRERLHHAFTQANIRMPSRLVDLGGQQAGYPMLLRDDGEVAGGGQRRWRRGLVPPGVGPLDQAPDPDREPDGPTTPPADRTVRRPHDTGDLDLTEVSGDVYGDTPDLTTELRIERGREPRPD